MKPHQPVEVVRVQGVKAEKLDIKRLHVPGCKITSKCPKCGAIGENDLGREYLSYPTLDKPTEVSFGCDLGCDTEWTALVQVSIEIRAVAPEPTENAKRDAASKRRNKAKKGGRK